MTDIIYLKDKNPHQLDDHITFEEGPHIYTIDGDSGFTSVTTWNHTHFSEFNADLIIDKMMKGKNWTTSKYFGMSKEEIKKQWDDNRDQAAAAGTKMHYDIECFYNNMEVTNDSVEYGYFNSFYNDYKELEAYRTEWMIYDKELKLAGSIDMIFMNKEGNLEIYDWKRCREIKKTGWGSSKTQCISHLPDSNYWHYSLQLNTYKAIIEKNYGKKVVKMCLVCMHPENSNKSYLHFEVPDLSVEIKELFNYRMLELTDKSALDSQNLVHEKNKIINKLVKHKNIINSLEIKLDAINSKLNASNTVEVDEKTYDSKIYYVDPSTFDILNDEGDIIGKWDKSADKPLLIF